MVSAFFVVLSQLFSAPRALGRHTNEPIYQDPFDIAAGGASMTRASKDGRLYANPAQLPVGGAFHRWLGLTTTVLVNRESIATARKLVEQKGGDSDSEAGSDNGESTGAFSDCNDDGTGTLVDCVVKNPVLLGVNASLSWITRNFGFGVFSRLEPEIRAREIGSAGFPEVSFAAESYHGVALGGAFRSPWRSLSFGLTVKEIFAAEPDEHVTIDGPDAAKRFQDPTYIKSQVAHNRGLGTDVGMQWLLQGSSVDFTVAGIVQDVGNTRLVGDNESLQELKQVVGAGCGLTLHTSADALHLAVDYRDILGAYGEETFKRVYAGAKVLLRTYVGFGVGLYNGYPSYGVELDLIILRLSATAYTREMGDHPGADPRHIYMLSTSAGF